MATFKKTFEPKLLYVYRINDESHKNSVKVGEASVPDAGLQYFSLQPNSKPLNEAAKERIKHQTQTAGITYELLYTEITAYQDKKELKVFQDHEIHQILERSGIKRIYFDEKNKANEWFYTDLETVKKAITAAKQGRTTLTAHEITENKNPVIFRPEQKKAIEETIRQFTKKNCGKQMLWNAKMRFGKTLSALQVIKECDIRRTLILTHRPVVDEGWFEDYIKIFYDRLEFLFVSKNRGESLAEAEKHAQQTGTGSYIYFVSIQDMRGSELVGGKFDKNKQIFNINWDLIILDEAHEGTQTELGKNVLAACKKNETRLLHLSGTPYNLMDDFKEDEIFTWDYVMEQKAKTDWDNLHQGDPNPYAGLPKMNIYTYNLGSLFTEYADADIAFNFKEFFRVDTDVNFIHKSTIIQFLDLLTKEDPKSNYPFSKQEFRENFRHSLWMIPGVKEAKALSKLLQEHSVFCHFNIANVAGDGDEEEEEKQALQKVQNAITDKPEQTYSITLSCGRLTTGVSVKPWTACFMLAGSYSTSASSYMQTIFRVQTPAIINGKQKQECFVFDFAPDRTLKIIAEAAKISAKAGNTSHEDRTMLGNFLNFCPIIGFDGSNMIAYDVPKMLEQLKKAYVERVVRNGFEDGYLYNNDLLKLDEKALNEFKNLKKIIGTTKAMPKTGEIDINTLGFTDEEFEQTQKEKQGDAPAKPELTQEQRERLEKFDAAKKNRDTAISILRGISIRMPLLIYGADLQKDLHGEDEPLTLDTFADTIDDQSWQEFMPAGVTKEMFTNFKKYYDADVFSAAGKRIRETAKAADSLCLEERISRISTIFNTFRNPDKETVLTPWRVVNMHLTDCLGGYRFYDETYTNTIESPVFVEQNDTTKNVYKKNTRILEINSKSGLYTLYCAYAVYKTRSKLELGPNPTRGMQTELWNKVLDENIFLICKTPMSKSIAKRTLAGFTNTKVNAHYFEDLISQLKHKPENFINKIIKTQYWKKDGTDMQFDAIVGNPPYQITASGDANGSDPIYHLFIDTACKIASKVTMIHPARFLFNAGKTPKEWNQKILNDEHFKVVNYWADSSEVFPTVDIKGGVAVTYWDKDKTFGKIGAFVAHKELKSILEKVLKNKFSSIIEIMNLQNKFNFDTLYKDYPEYKNIIGSNGADKRLRPNTFDKLDVFKEEKDVNDIGIHGLIKNKRVMRFIKSKYIEDSSDLNKYKVLVPKANGSGAIGEILSTPLIGEPLIGEPLIGYTGSFIGIGSFDEKKEAEAAIKYIKSKFARAMLGTLKVTQDNPKETWANVPLQDFTSSSDIDWSKSVSEIDKQLYNKYKLDSAEIEFIEKMIKVME